MQSLYKVKGLNKDLTVTSVCQPTTPVPKFGVKIREDKDEEELAEVGQFKVQ